MPPAMQFGPVEHSRAVMLCNGVLDALLRDDAGAARRQRRARRMAIAGCEADTPGRTGLPTPPQR